MHFITQYFINPLTKFSFNIIEPFNVILFLHKIRNCITTPPMHVKIDLSQFSIECYKNLCITVSPTEVTVPLQVSASSCM